MGGWLAIVSDRKSRIALFEFPLARCSGSLDSTCSFTAFGGTSPHADASGSATHGESLAYDLDFKVMLTCPVQKWQLDLRPFLIMKASFLARCLLYIKEERKREVRKCVPRVNLAGKQSTSSGKPNASSSTQIRQLDMFVGSRISSQVSALRIIFKNMCDNTFE